MPAVVKESFTGGELTKKYLSGYSGGVQVLGLASLLNQIPNGVQHALRACFFIASYGWAHRRTFGFAPSVGGVRQSCASGRQLIGVSSGWVNLIQRRQYHA